MICPYCGATGTVLVFKCDFNEGTVGNYRCGQCEMWFNDVLDWEAIDDASYCTLLPFCDGYCSRNSRQVLCRPIGDEEDIL